MNNGFVINEIFRRKRSDLKDCSDKCLWNLAYVKSCRDAYETSCDKVLSGDITEFPNVIRNMRCERDRIRIVKKMCPKDALDRI